MCFPDILFGAFVTMVTEDDSPVTCGTRHMLDQWHHRELTISFDKDWVARKAPDSHDGIEKNALSTLGLFSLICMNGLK